MTWRGKGRSGVGDQYLGQAHEDLSNLSPNGRQWANPLTGEWRDLSGSDYWHLRKALNVPSASVAEDSASPIRWDSYSCPSYYHLPKQEKKVEIIEETVDTDVQIDNNECKQEKSEQSSVFLSLSEGNIFRNLYLKWKK